MTERSHLSIGEVLSLLREEFPDVTISKIRFLESQGLVDPERTPSGYRKFYDHDVDRLRWILRQQRENFLPLKVIRGRLTEHEEAPPDVLGASTAPPTARSDPLETGPAESASDSGNGAGHDAAGDDEEDVGSARRLTQRRGPVGAIAPALAPVAVPAPAPAPPRPPAPSPSIFADLRGSQSGGRRGPSRPEAGSTRRSTNEPAVARTAVPEPDEPVTGRPPASRVRSAPPALRSPARRADDTDTYTAEELAAAAGGLPSLVAELKQYGLISPHAVVAGTSYYDDGALLVVRAAAEFAGHGVEVRHLRIWRNAVDREADLFQQIVLPLLRQRNPQSRNQAGETLAELSRLGGELRAALIDRAIDEIR